MTSEANKNKQKTKQNTTPLSKAQLPELFTFGWSCALPPPLHFLSLSQFPTHVPHFL